MTYGIPDGAGDPEMTGVAAGAADLRDPRVRDRTLDSFRALFILAVLLFHYLVRWAPPREGFDLYGYTYRYATIFEYGQFGVQAFFLISGIFITVTLLRSRDAMEFAYKRVLRLYPAFVVAATITFVVVRLAGPPVLRVDVRDYLLTLTLVGGDLGGRAVDGAFWSLAVEAKFYFWVALAFHVLRGRFWIGLIALAFAGIAIEPRHAFLATSVLLAPFMPLFLGGVALAYHHVRRETRTALAIAAAAALSYALNRHAYALHDGSTLGANICILGAVGIVVGVTLARIRIANPVLVYLGLISYELYLVHQNIGIVVIRRMKVDLHAPDWAAFAAAVLVSVALAALVNRHLQRPIQWLIRRSWTAARGSRPPGPVLE